MSNANIFTDFVNCEVLEHLKGTQKITYEVLKTTADVAASPWPVSVDEVTQVATQLGRQASQSE